VRLAIYNAKGECVRTLIERSQLNAQVHRLIWDGRNEQGHGLASGVYVARLHMGERESSTRKLLLLK
jgi:flagellar hook assembly protein FlgD